MAQSCFEHCPKVSVLQDVIDDTVASGFPASNPLLAGAQRRLDEFAETCPGTIYVGVSLDGTEVHTCSRMNDEGPHLV